MLIKIDAEFAPIVLFVFARPDHTRRTLDALVANKLAGESDLIIYADGARNVGEQDRVNLVRAIVNSLSGFKSVTVVEREINYGLARNIIEGVSDVCSRYGRAIVLEDDIVTSPQFLTFMNAALDRYADDSRVWHISGWNYPINTEGLGDVFLWRLMNCWGWATWADRWVQYKKEPARLVREWSSEDIHRFNLDGGQNFWEQVTRNNDGALNTWAIFWYATIFENNGFCVNPSLSYVNNIGLDGSGENCGGSNTGILLPINNVECNVFGCDIVESDIAVQRIQKYYKDQKKTLFVRVINKIARSTLGRNVL
ncbi:MULTISPECIES: glycosyltransferase family 2 protein [unclassified Acidovorax]|uniref:glycosyltransferase family 2 protein n=1 Tax=unclassified Acidovorax TaxID=2684926 RepID=UPI0018DFEA08|nr:MULTISPECIES: glycosyltransferase family 2 protein [unclassified Acidovorax]